MTAIQTYVVFSTVIFAFLALVWSGGTLVNAVLKFLFVLLTGFGILVALAVFGVVLSNGIRLV